MMTYPLAPTQGADLAQPHQPAPGALTPAAAAALDEFAALRASIDAHAAALAQHQPAPLVPSPQPAPGALAVPQYHAPQYHAPTYTAPQYGAYAPEFKPVVNVLVESSARTDDHSSAGGAWCWIVAALFFLPFAAIAVGGGE
jgi:hypothetical protein